MSKIALELDNNNVIIGTVFLASQDYTQLLQDNPNLVVADVENINDIVEYKTKYQNGQLVPLEDYTQEYYSNQQNEELRLQLQSAIQEIEDWFNDYDMQIKQFNRDVRLGEVGTYHIGNNNYTIQELDALATQKASDISSLRTQLNNL